MRVIYPKKPQYNPTRVSGSHLSLLVAFVAASGIIAYLAASSEPTRAPSQNTEIAVNQAANVAPPPKKGTFKKFSGEEFKKLYNGFAYPNTARINEKTPITGNEAADERIRQLAVERGYQLRSAPVSNVLQDIGDNEKLQQRAAQPWHDLVAAAKKEGINLGITAGYRSADDQRQIFIERLDRLGVPVAAIAGGAYDSKIIQVLRTTSIPGYSNHHTGYTVDIACKNTPGVSFMYSPCFGWLSANNYEKAKKFGWIPSYPEGAGKQGPDPESWEYVWVGVDAVTE